MLFLEKGSHYWGKFIGFSVNEFCVSPIITCCPQTPPVTDFQWWKGRVAEVLLKKEISKETKRLVFRGKDFSQ